MLRGKAAQIKGLTPALLKVWNDGNGDVNEGMVRLVRLALEASVCLDTMLDDHVGPRLPPAVSRKFFQVAGTYRQLISQLQN